MSARITLLVAAGLIAGFAPAPFPRRERLDSGQVQRKKLQGAWVRTRSLVGGKVQSAAATTVVIAGDRLTYTFVGTPSYEYTMTLNPARAPKVLDIRGISRGVRGTTFWGIYRLEGDDTLIVCSRMGPTENLRPTDFDESRPGVYFEVFHRRKP
jgi:uncharacterized protein (TIGR03067 family)